MCVPYTEDRWSRGIIVQIHPFVDAPRPRARDVRRRERTRRRRDRARAMSSADATASLVRALVERTVRGRRKDDEDDDEDEEDRARRVDAGCRYAARVLGSTLGASTVRASSRGDRDGELGDCATRIARRARRRFGDAAATRAADACERLRRDGSGLRRREGVLRVLLAISEDVERDEEGTSMSMPTTTTRASASRFDLEEKSRAVARDARRDSRRVGGEDAVRALVGGARGALGVHSIGRRAEAYEALEIESESRGERDERDLVRDALYACQGIDGECIAFSPAEQAYVIAPNVNVSAGRRNLIKCVTEIGWLFKKVKGALGETRASGVDVDDGDGSTRQAFRAALQRELADYYKLIAVLESQAQLPIVSFAKEASGGRGDGGDGYLTLRRLFVWLTEPLKTMRTLAILVDATHGKRGGGMLAVMQKLSQHGDPSSTALVRRVLSASATPFLGMVHRWTLSGELEDPSHEFFVRVDHAVPDKDLWQCKYAFDDDMLPSFVTREQGKTILRLGKSINFLRRCCDDASWTPERSEIMHAVEKVGGLDFENPEGLVTLIDETSRRVDGAVRRVLFDRYQLGRHCDALKRYLLLGQGDLHECLMDLMGPSLDEPANSLSVFKLSGTLEQAIRSSSAQTDAPEFIDRLRVRLMAHLNEEVGWDVFTLEYVVNQPLTTIFTETAMNKYLRVFNFLWRLKRVEYSLCATWQMMKPSVTHLLSSEAREVGASGEILVEMIRNCHSLRGEMHNFISNFQYYVMFEVLETSWVELQEKFETHSDLDEIIAAHDVFLDAVVQKALLGTKSQLVLQTLYALFEVMMSFREVAGDLFNLAADVVAKRAATRERIAEREKANQWGTYVGEDSTSGDFIDKDELGVAQARLATLRDEYARALDGFLNLLPLQTHVDARFLLFRLDFSSYYVSQGIGPGDVSVERATTRRM